MGVVQATQSITTTASQLGSARGGRSLLAVRNPGGSGRSIYIGGSGVTVATALFVLAPGDPTLTITTGEHDSLGGEDWYAITSTGTAAGVVVGSA